MKNTLEKIIKEIPKGRLFDTHSIIECLLRRYSDQYLDFYQGGGTTVHHQKIAFILVEFVNEGVIERVGESNTKIWSQNIHKNFTPCTCWKKR
jgi:hypothetical protein